jgi:hypothetical protein
MGKGGVRLGVFLFFAAEVRVAFSQNVPSQREPKQRVERTPTYLIF